MRVKYPTKPFECWQKAKEMRLQNYKNIINAKADGKLLFAGQRGAPTEVMAGFGDIEFLGMNDYAASVAHDPPMALEAFERWEAKGYARDVCAYWRCFMGSVLTDHFYFGGQFPKIDFVFTQNACDTNGKCQLLMAETLGAHYVMVDIPVVGDYRQSNKPYYVDYVAAQFNEAIEKVSRISGRKYDDEKLIEAVYNRCSAEILWSEIMMMNQVTPCPMDMKAQYTFLVPLLVAKYKPETVEYYKGLKQEMEERVKEGIAAVPTERFRLLHHGAPPWHSLRFFRVPQAYGAIFMGSDFSIIQFAAFEEKPNGTFGPRQDPREIGVKLRNREEALRFFAEWYIQRGASTWCGAKTRIDHQLHLVKEWHVDGVVYHVDRGCENNTSGVLESKIGVSNALKVPTMIYEGNRGDTRDWSEAESIDRLESFLESVGLRKLEE